MRSDSDSECPICRKQSWKELGRKTWFKDSEHRFSSYDARRLRVLFEVWFPGRTTVELLNCVCAHCGFVTNLPRVEPHDIDAKYQFLEESGQDYGAGEPEEIVTRRSRRLLNHCRPYLCPGARVLDFGGGDGRLMEAFADDGYSCSLIDYNQNPRGIVQRLGSTIEEVPIAAEFQLAICNHVIEHVADPVATLRSVSKLLKADGFIFVEVPMEIWKRPPLLSEPVTHVNFFVPGSLRRTLEEAGLRVLECRLTSYLHPSGRILPAVIAVGRKTRDHISPNANGYAEVCRCLAPGLWARINRSWKLGENLPAVIKYHLKRWSVGVRHSSR